MLKQRIITAVILTSAIVSVVIYLPVQLLALIFALFVSVGAWEWSACAGIVSKGYKMLYVFAVLLCMATCFYSLDAGWLAVLVYAGLLWWHIAIFLVVYYQRKRAINLSSVWLKLLIGILILMPTWLSLILIHQQISGPELVLVLFFIVWLADSAAYFSGRKFARKQLASNISPAKSWEGVYAALLVPSLSGIVYALYTGMQLKHTVLFIIVVFLTVVFSILGDLTASMFKRIAGIKDSGRILPGHGGVLDRVDSLTAAAPVFFSGLYIMGKIA